MGMFDVVVVHCPECGLAIEVQTKAGPCKMNIYHSQNAPAYVAASVIDACVNCECGARIMIAGNVAIWPVVIISGTGRLST